MQWLPWAALAGAALSTALAANPDPRAEFERRLAPFRKLQETDIPAGCLSACPALSSMQEDIDAMAVSFESINMSMDAELIAPTFEKFFTDQFALSCKHKDALTCAAANAAVCDDSDDTADEVAASMIAMENTMECMCTQCPNLPAAMGGAMGWFMSMMMQAMADLGASLGGGSTPAPPTEEEQMEVLCPMVGPFKCAAAQSSCAASMQALSVEDSPMNVSDVTAMEAQCTENGYSLEPAADGAPSASAELALLGSLAVASALVG